MGCLRSGVWRWGAAGYSAKEGRQVIALLGGWRRRRSALYWRGAGDEEGQRVICAMVCGGDTEPQWMGRDRVRKGGGLFALWWC